VIAGNYQRVTVPIRDEDIPGFPRYKTKCSRCGEQIMDQREVVVDRKEVCRICAEGSYYRIIKYFKGMTSGFQDPVPPYPSWVLREYRLSRPVTEDDIAAFLGNEELYVRDTATGPVNIIHKYGLLEIHTLIGEKCIEVWFNPDKGVYPSEYLDALLKTRFN
jgi:hypothetical protein